MTDSADGSGAYFDAVEMALQKLGHGGRSWVPAVLIALGAEPLRYSDLLKRINSLGMRWGSRSMSDKALWQTLNRLQEDGLVVKHRTQGYQPEAWYELTTRARALLVALRPLAQWAQS